jgi:hypothetical protein
MIIGFNHITRTGGNALLRRVHAAPHGEAFRIATFDALSTREALDALPKAPYVFSHSHVMSGLHQRFRDDFAYVTLVREPVAHLLSEFAWSRGIELFDLPARRIMEMLEAYVDGFAHLNHQCFMIATPVAAWPVLEAHPNRTNLGEASTDLAAAALDMLEAHYLFVGMSERMADMFRVFEHHFGMRDLMTAGGAFRNAMAAGPLSQAALPPSLRRAIQEKSQADLELHDYVRARALREIGALRGAGDGCDGAGPVFPAADYTCRLGVAWRYFVEGLLAIGAMASHPGDEWVLEFALPVALEGAAYVGVTITLIAFTKDGRTCRLDAAIRIGTQEQGLVIGGRHEVACVVHADEVVDGRLPFSLRAVGIDVESRDVYAFNPLPFMIDGIVMSAVEAGAVAVGDGVQHA